MRKDVKLGFAIGGVMLAVLIVYVLVVPGGTDQRLSQAVNGTSSQTASGVRLEPVVPPPVNPNGSPSLNPTTKPADNNAVAAGPQAPPAAPPAAVVPPPVDPFEQPKPDATAAARAADAKSRDVDWNKLLNDSQMLMQQTPVRTGNAVAAQSSTPVSQQEHDATATASSASAGAPDITRPGPTPATQVPAPAPAAGDATAKADPTPQPPAAPEVPPPAAAPPQTASNTNATGASPTPAPEAAPAPTSLPPPPPAAPAGETASNATNNTNTTTDATAARSHTVAAGDSFSSIAIQAYGNANFYPAIMRANPSIDPQKLKPGMKIVLPPIAEVNPVRAAAAAPSAAGEAQVISSKVEAPVDPQTQYRVQPGDSLYRISVKLYGRGDQAVKIHDSNKATMGDDPHRLKPGQVLALPAPPTKLQASSR